MKRKVGLVLGGGGAKGAYQVGVYKALRDQGLIDEIKAISGTSIGALNLALLALQEVDQAAEIWLSLTKRKVLTLKHWKEYLDFKNFSVLSRKGMLEIFSSEIDFKRVSDCRIPLYVCATNLRDNVGETFKLNGLSEEEIIDRLSASSAIPTIFPNVEINGIRYMDGYLYDNVPINSLVVNEGCNFLYVVPLSAFHFPKPEDYPNQTLIVFDEPAFDDLKLWDGTLSFGHDVAKYRLELGYDNAMRLINYLRQKGLIYKTRKEKVRHMFAVLTRRTKKLKKYYSVSGLDPVIKEEKE